MADIVIILKRQKSIREQRNRELYTQAKLIAGFVWSKRIPEFEEIFETTEEYETRNNNALVKELFLDYAERWNAIRKAGG